MRFKVTNKGKSITPLFCEHSDPKFDLSMQLAKKIIEELNDSSSMRESKGSILKKIALLESVYGDYKLVRGFYALLERRCSYVYNYVLSDMDFITNKKSITGNSLVPISGNVLQNKNVRPSDIRKMLFELASKSGHPLTDIKRAEIVDMVAAKIGISVDSLSKLVWSDLEENLVLERFDPISSESLVAWYNLSLIQTLLFNCIKLEFSVTGGINWKHALRAVKRLGLMYNLERRACSNETYAIEGTTQNMTHDHSYAEAESGSNIVCSIDGPLSIFKLTDRYGTAMSKLIPLIISLNRWSLKAWIVRNTLSSGKKIYEFHLSETSSYLLAELPQNDNNKPELNHFSGNDYFDSNVEERFASRFVKSVSDWKLTREPDPLILQNGKALIPDFIFEKYDRKIYLEIMGFWTKDYLLRKMQKLKAVIDIANSKPSNKIDLLIAINHDVYASTSSNLAETRAWHALISSITDKRLIVYKNQDIPLKPILDYLRSIDRHEASDLEMNGRISHIITELFQSMDNHDDVISIAALANKWEIEPDTLLTIVKSKAQNKDRMGDYTITEKYLISDPKLENVRALVANAGNLSEITRILAKNDIPESCLIDVISKLGFEIIWHGIDYSRASLKKKD